MKMVNVMRLLLVSLFFQIFSANAQQWCGFQEGRFQAVVNGEDYSLFNPTAARMRADCGSPSDQDLERKNGAITYIWLW